MVGAFAEQNIRRVILATLVCALAGSLSAADKIKINVRQSDATIRKQLLQLTPTGTSIQQVYKFLQQRLHYEGEVVGGPQHPYQLHALWADIGHYHERRSFSEGLFLFPTVVHVRWDFDKNNKLRDVQVQRGVMAW